MQNDFSSNSQNSQSQNSQNKSNDPLTEISNTIFSMQNSISSLQHARDKYLIYYQQYQYDFEEIKRIYISMKQSFHQNNFSHTNSINIETLNNSISTSENQKNNSDESEISINQQINKNFQLPLIADQNSLNQNIFHPIEHLQICSIDLPYQILSNNSNKLNVHLRYALQIPAVLCSAQFDPTGKIIAFSDGRLLHIISSENGTLISSIEIPRSPNKNELHTRTIRFSHDGKLIALSSMASSISLFSTETLKCIGTLDGHSKPVSSLLFLRKRPLNQSYNGLNQGDTTLVSGSFDGLLCIWDIPTMSLIKAIPHGHNEANGQFNRDGSIVSLATDSDESFIAVGFMKGVVGIYETSFLQPMNAFTAHNEYLLSVKMVPNESALVTTSNDKTAKLWALHGVSTCKIVFNSHQDYVICCSMASPEIGVVPGNEHLIKENVLMLTGSKDETLKGWNRRAGEELFTITGHKNTLFEIMHHPSNLSFISCSGDGLVCLWDYDSPPY